MEHFAPVPSTPLLPCSVNRIDHHKYTSGSKGKGQSLGVPLIVHARDGRGVLSKDDPFEVRARSRCQSGDEKHQCLSCPVASSLAMSRKDCVGSSRAFPISWEVSDSWQSGADPSPACATNHGYMVRQTILRDIIEGICIVDDGPRSCSAIQWRNQPPCACALTRYRLNNPGTHAAVQGMGSMPFKSRAGVEGNGNRAFFERFLGWPGGVGWGLGQEIGMDILQQAIGYSSRYSGGPENGDEIYFGEASVRLEMRSEIRYGERLGTGPNTDRGRGIVE